MSRGIVFFLLLLLCFLSIRVMFFFFGQSTITDSQEMLFTTTLLSEPKVIGTKQIVEVYLNGSENIDLILPLFPDFHYGDTVKIKGVVRERKTNTNAASSRMGKALEETKREFLMYNPVLERTTGPFLYGSLLSVVSRLRQQIRTLFASALPPDSAALLQGIVFGIKSPLSSTLYTQMQQAGVVHVIAASGMNVSMTAAFLVSLCGLLLRRQLAIVMSILGICLYLTLAGFEPSIVRATIMGTIAFTAQILGRQTWAVYSLVLTAFAMLIYSPLLSLDIGFQLSFLATLGLLYIKPLMDTVPFLQRPALISQDLTTTIAAQLATMPILLFHFGTYSLLSVIPNVLVLWTIPILMVIGACGTFVGLLLPELGKLVLYLAIPLLLYFQCVVGMAGTFGWEVETQEFSVWFLIAYYLLLTACVIVFRKRQA